MNIIIINIHNQVHNIIRRQHKSGEGNRDLQGVPTRLAVQVELHGVRQICGVASLHDLDQGREPRLRQAHTGEKRQFDVCSMLSYLS